jgi:DNA-binding LacI/PurR family transcriptional regulator
LVVNKKKSARISDETRKRVRDAIRELGYRPNAMAQTLVSGSSRFIGLVADAIATTPFAGQIIHGAQDEAWKHGYALLIANTEGNRELETDAIAMMLEYKVRGILYSTWFHRATEIPASLRESDFVLVNCFSTSPVPGPWFRTKCRVAVQPRRSCCGTATAESPSSTPPSPPRPRTDDSKATSEALEEAAFHSTPSW